ncbi:hypothetical protein DL763_003366 [Monosporascus cannonballus]|nr:hypothetical protein DL763_003366 [Monosporascus cannonballus]
MIVRQYVIISCTEHVQDYPTHYAQVVTLFRALAKTSNANRIRPLVLWSSGGKVYGYSPVDGTPGLAPLAEKSPLEVPPFVRPWTPYPLKIFDNENAELFDAMVRRPPNVDGYSSSYYRIIFEWAEMVASNVKEAKGEDGYELAIDPRTVLSAMRVDDCGEGYVALAEHPDRSQIVGQVFNLGPHSYETTDKMLKAVAKEYDIPGGFKFKDTEQARKNASGVIVGLLAWSQWVGSDKIRRESRAGRTSDRCSPRTWQFTAGRRESAS